MRKWRISYDENFVSGRKKKAALRAKLLKETKTKSDEWKERKEENQQIHLIFYENGTFGLSHDHNMYGVGKDKCYDICNKRIKVRR